MTERFNPRDILDPLILEAIGSGQHSDQMAVDYVTDSIQESPYLDQIEAYLARKPLLQIVI